MVALKPLDRLPPEEWGEVKQERRGGIETRTGRASPARIRRKQERCGGIETGNESMCCRIVKTKQERRGGIETQESDSTIYSIYKEAGTPWWH